VPRNRSELIPAHLAGKFTPEELAYLRIEAAFQVATRFEKTAARNVMNKAWGELPWGVRQDLVANAFTNQMRRFFAEQIRASRKPTSKTE